ncbi:Txe/YoeB family toxin of Txe-Axe toxin-antitoxin module [Streptococcus rupicaprae]|uniref:Txe/YoeB family toxin of Txe-Axe toxin-antitoxin module n=1 Tax=Streptococcus rupicaprae TaxID=759619 RepID=A0ABV2FKY1_9STRE
MRKPLLTDDILAQAGYDDQLKDTYLDQQATKEIHFDRRDFEEFEHSDEPESLTSRIEVIPSIIKSRRIENEKRSVFQSKLNQILAILLILGLALVLAIIYL